MGACDGACFVFFGGSQQHTDSRLQPFGHALGLFGKWAIDEASLPSVEVNIQGVEAATINNRGRLRWIRVQRRSRCFIRCVCGVL